MLAAIVYRDETMRTNEYLHTRPTRTFSVLFQVRNKLTISSDCSWTPRDIVVILSYPFELSPDTFASGELHTLRIPSPCRHMKSPEHRTQVGSCAYAIAKELLSLASVESSRPVRKGGEVLAASPVRRAF